MTLPPDAPTLVPPRRRPLRRFLIFLTTLYLLTSLLLFFAQDYMIFPGALLNPPPLTSTPDLQLVDLPSPIGPITALYAPATDPAGRPLPDAPTRPAVLFFYGNGACIAYSRTEARTFSRMGFNVLIPEYPGYPLSPGRPSAANILHAADAAYAHLTQTLHIPPSRIAVIGQSIGGAPAIYLASKHPVGALVTLSAFRSLNEIAANTVRHLFPVSLLVRHHFDNLARMKSVRCPTLLTHGTADDLIPFTSAADLAQATPAPTTLYPVPGANHNDLYDVGGPDLLHTLESFLTRSLIPQAPPTTKESRPVPGPSSSRSPAQ